MKTLLILLALALLAGFLLWMRADVPIDAGGGSDAVRSPSFVVRVEKPRLARPLFGILPRALEEQLAEDGDLWFDDASPGAAMLAFEQRRLELGADGWSLILQTDGAGEIAAGTHLVFSLMLAGKRQTLRCRPADPPSGHLQISTRAGSDELDGRFLVELAVCQNAETGKTINWPPAPLTVHGSFEGVAHRHFPSRRRR